MSYPAPGPKPAIRMRHLELTEGQEKEWYGSLTPEQFEALKEAGVQISPLDAKPEGFRLTWGTATPRVGAVTVGDAAVIIRPKIPVDRVMFLITYAMDPERWRDRTFPLAPHQDLPEACALSFSHHVQRAIRRGLLRRYRREEDAPYTVRGRIRFGDQIRRRRGLLLPVEVAYDDYTEDIEQNRLLKTALHRLTHARIRQRDIRQKLRSLRPAFDLVQLGSYPRGAVPEISYTRLDQHYRPATELARLIIQNCSLDLFSGNLASMTFLISMSQVFEEFLHVALGEALRLRPEQWRRGAGLRLDGDGVIKLKPDLSWWPSWNRQGGTLPLFVGDAKYKSTDVDEEIGSPVHHADIYQMLAYCIAANRPSGLLIYASGKKNSKELRIRHVGKTIEIASLDISGSPSEILRDVARIAERVRVHACGAVK